jgi:Asp/Glu/hydantoin racemase
MRLLVVNPNTSRPHTETILAAARDAAAPGTTVVAVNAPFGPAYIDSRAEATVAAYATLTALAEHAAGSDAAVIAGFVDPGVGAARELLRLPVVGIVEASCLTACMLGSRFAIVGLSDRLGPVFRDIVNGLGLRDRLAAIELVRDPDERLVYSPDGAVDLLADAARKAIAEAEAEVIILGGAPLAGIAPQLAQRLEVPVLDGVRCGVRQAELLAGLGARKPSAGSFRHPGARRLAGVSPAVESLFVNQHLGRTA